MSNEKILIVLGRSRAFYGFPEHESPHPETSENKGIEIFAASWYALGEA